MQKSDIHASWCASDVPGHGVWPAPTRTCPLSTCAKTLNMQVLGHHVCTMHGVTSTSYKVKTLYSGEVPDSYPVGLLLICFPSESGLGASEVSRE